jgi:hypothetical protein
MLVISVTVALKFVMNVLITVTLVITLLIVPLIVQKPDTKFQTVHVKQDFMMMVLPMPLVKPVTINVLLVQVLLPTVPLVPISEDQSMTVHV